MKRNVVNRDTLPPVFSERDTSAGDEPFSLMMRAMGIAASAMLEDIGNNIPVPENPRTAGYGMRSSANPDAGAVTCTGKVNL
jgi:hypothetical protein